MIDMSNTVETVHLNFSDGWRLPGSTTPSDNQCLICFREGFPLFPMICVYHAESGNFYQCFQKIGNKKTTLNLTIVTDIVAFKPLENIYRVEVA